MQEFKLFVEPMVAVTAQRLKMISKRGEVAMNVCAEKTETQEEKVTVRCPRCQQIFRDVTLEVAEYIKKNLCAVCQVPMRREGE
jgi:uncharacterized paraquat-inducible protein A